MQIRDGAISWQQVCLPNDSQYSLIISYVFNRKIRICGSAIAVTSKQPASFRCLDLTINKGAIVFVKSKGETEVEFGRDEEAN